MRSSQKKTIWFDVNVEQHYHVLDLFKLATNDTFFPALYTLILDGHALFVTVPNYQGTGARFTDMD